MRYSVIFHRSIVFYLHIPRSQWLGYIILQLQELPLKNLSAAWTPPPSNLFTCICWRETGSMVWPNKWFDSVKKWRPKQENYGLTMVTVVWFGFGIFDCDRRLTLSFRAHYTKIRTLTARCSVETLWFDGCSFKRRQTKNLDEPTLKLTIKWIWFWLRL